MLHVAAVLLFPALVAPSPMQEDAVTHEPSDIVRLTWENAWLNTPPLAGDRARYPAPLLVDYPQWSVGLGVDVYTGFGSVFNDVVGASIRGSYRLDPRWSVAASIFKTDFDFEDPADNVFGRSNTPVSDASIDMFIVSATVRWHFFEPRSSVDIYIGAGLGLAFPGSGEAVLLPQIDIEVDGNFGPEAHVVAGGAIRIYDQLHATVELRLMQSFTKYDVEDRLTGETETENGWGGMGIALGLEWRF